VLQLEKLKAKDLSAPLRIYKTWAWKLWGKETLGGLRLRWENNIKWDFREIGNDGVAWTGESPVMNFVEHVDYFPWPTEWFQLFKTISLLWNEGTMIASP
jgi:hypothetical protein